MIKFRWGMQAKPTPAHKLSSGDLLFPLKLEQKKKNWKNCKIWKKWYLKELIDKIRTPAEEEEESYTQKACIVWICGSLRSYGGSL